DFGAGLGLVFLVDHRVGELGLYIWCGVDHALAALADLGQSTQLVTRDRLSRDLNPPAAQADLSRQIAPTS
ncbi:hypothetical protein, partial [Mycobacterium florentinum]|uniref:hypothetical protein n=1 Tax=Mycobacterium florentinum TaxID=292462 RepID=UPI001B800168